MALYYYGWKPPRPEQLERAPKYAAPRHILAALPSKVDLRNLFPPPFDQGQLGSCTANMSAGMIVYNQKQQGLPVVTPSRLFDYYNSRKLEGTTSQDAGASIADAVQALAKYGYCPETEWPYDIYQFATTPPSQCYSDAVANKVKDYQNVQPTLNDLKAALAGGEAVGIGVVVYPSFESQSVAQSGMVPVPSLREQMGQALGGHAILLVGYDDALQCFLFRNSWGTSWGQQGYGCIPYQFVLNSSLASDFWLVRSVPGSTPPQPPSPPAPPSPPDPPTPGPDVNPIQQMIDGLFAQLEAAVQASSAGMLAKLFLLSALKQLQQAVDSLFTANPQYHAAEGSFPLTPDQIKELADVVLGIAATLFAGKPAVAAIIEAIKKALDIFLSQQAAPLLSWQCGPCLTA